MRLHLAFGALFDEPVAAEAALSHESLGIFRFKYVGKRKNLLPVLSRTHVQMQSFKLKSAVVKPHVSSSS